MANQNLQLADSNAFEVPKHFENNLISRNQHNSAVAYDREEFSTNFNTPLFNHEIRECAHGSHENMNGDTYFQNLNHFSMSDFLNYPEEEPNFFNFTIQYITPMEEVPTVINIEERNNNIQNNSLLGPQGANFFDPYHNNPTIIGLCRKMGHRGAHTQDIPKKLDNKNKSSSSAHEITNDAAEATTHPKNFLSIPQTNFSDFNQENRQFLNEFSHKYENPKSFTKSFNHSDNTQRFDYYSHLEYTPKETSGITEKDFPMQEEVVNTPLPPISCFLKNLPKFSNPTDNVIGEESGEPLKQLNRISSANMTSTIPATYNIYKEVGDPEQELQELFSEIKGGKRYHNIVKWYNIDTLRSWFMKENAPLTNFTLFLILFDKESQNLFDSYIDREKFNSLLDFICNKLRSFNEKQDIMVIHIPQLLNKKYKKQMEDFQTLEALPTNCSSTIAHGSISKNGNSIPETEHSEHRARSIHYASFPFFYPDADLTTGQNHGNIYSERTLHTFPCGKIYRIDSYYRSSKTSRSYFSLQYGKFHIDKFILKNFLKDLLEHEFPVLIEKLGEERGRSIDHKFIQKFSDTPIFSKKTKNLRFIDQEYRLTMIQDSDFLTHLLTTNNKFKDKLFPKNAQKIARVAVSGVINRLNDIFAGLNNNERRETDLCEWTFRELVKISLVLRPFFLRYRTMSEEQSDFISAYAYLLRQFEIFNPLRTKE